MHELSVCMALVAEVEKLVSREGGRRALSITVQYGALSGIDPESLAFCFPMAAEGCAAAGAKLILQSLPTRFKCRKCGVEDSSSRPLTAARIAELWSWNYYRDVNFYLETWR